MPAATDDGPDLPELTFTRTFDAPRELVFKVWTDPYHVAQWWGPHGFTIPVSKVDARVGGRFEVHMLSARTARCCRRSARSTRWWRRSGSSSRSNLEDGNGNKLIEVVNTRDAS